MKNNVKKEKRSLILDTAYKLFIEKGYKSVTTREIAKFAGVSKGVLYHYFESKEDLFFHTISELLPINITVRKALENKDFTPKDRFHFLKEICDKDADKREARIRLSFDFLVHCRDKELVKEVIGSLTNIIKSIVSEIISGAFPGLNDEPEALELYSKIIAAYIDGIHFQYFIDPKSANIITTNKVFWEIIETHLARYAAS
ncbi:TetR/AcrR family transcriptional regulator [candidate division KSB1 bacterium]